LDTKIYSRIRFNETAGLATTFGTYAARLVSFETNSLKPVPEKTDSGITGI
jgi:hypothetical protein